MTAPTMVEAVTIEPVDVLRTRVTLQRLAGRQDQLREALRQEHFASVPDRLDWLIAHRTADEQLAWARKWRTDELNPVDTSAPPPTVAQLEATPPPKRSPLTREEFLEELQWLIDGGCNRWEIAEALDMNLDAIEARCRRYGRQDLARHVATPWEDRTDRKKAS